MKSGSVWNTLRNYRENKPRRIISNSCINLKHHRKTFLGKKKGPKGGPIGIKNVTRVCGTQGKWTSLFLSNTDKIIDKDRKIELFRQRIISLEKRARKLELKLVLDREPSKEEIGENAIELEQTADKFYRSLKWKRARFNFLMKSQDKSCSLCGNFSNIHVDHIQPRSLRPDLALDESNFQLLCSDCNIGKGVSTGKIIRRSSLKATPT